MAEPLFQPRPLQLISCSNISAIQQKEERQSKWWQMEEGEESGRHCYHCHQVGPVHLKTADDKTVVIRVLKTVKSGRWRWPHEDDPLSLSLSLLLGARMFRLRFCLLECFVSFSYFFFFFFFTLPHFPPPVCVVGVGVGGFGRGWKMLCRVVKCTDDTMSRPCNGPIVFTWRSVKILRDALRSFEMLCHDWANGWVSLSEVALSGLIF